MKWSKLLNEKRVESFKERRPRNRMREHHLNETTAA